MGYPISKPVHGVLLKIWDMGYPISKPVHTFSRKNLNMGYSGNIPFYTPVHATSAESLIRLLTQYWFPSQIKLHGQYVRFQVTYLIVRRNASVVNYPYRDVTLPQPSPIDNYHHRSSQVVRRQKTSLKDSSQINTQYKKNFR